MTTLADLRAFILDMDGVLYQGRRALPGAREFITALQRHRIPFRLLTNNSARTAADYVAGLAEIGIAVHASHILTSAGATALYLKETAPPGARVMVIGERGLRDEITAAGFQMADDGACDYVAVGMDRQITYEKLKRATLAIRRGARFIGSNPDRTFPTEEGLVPGAGSLLAALQAATDVAPVIIGKPQPTTFRLALTQMGVEASMTAMIGDRLETDVVGGKGVGLVTILVLTGVTTRADLERAPVQPDYVFADLTTLSAAWQKALRKD